MNLFTLDISRYSALIPSFLEAAAHSNSRKTEERHRWKFFNNHFGKSLLACAEEDGVTAEKAGYAMQDFYL